MRPLSEAPYLDLFDPDFQTNPDPYVAALRKESSVLRTPIGASVIDKAGVHELLRERSLHSSLLHLLRLQGVNDGPLYDLAAASLLGLEGDDHTRLRRLVSRSFTPRAADGHREFMRQLVRELTAAFSGRGECEFMSEFADHYPVQVIAHLMGVPRKDHGLFAKWGDALTHLLSLELFQYRAEVEAAQSQMSEYLTGLVADRRKNPRDDLVTELITARDGSDRLNDSELLSLLGGLLFAGYDTTRNQLAVAMTIFAEHHDHWEALAHDPGLAPKAVDEIMRFAGVVSVVPRVTTTDLEVGEWLIPAGTLVSLSLVAANHDPAVYDDPDGFDPTAEHESHVSFGGGAHHCLGANLARAEMQEALPLLAAAMPAVTVAEPPEWRSPLGGIAGPLRLRLSFTPTPGGGTAAEATHP
ncbi:MAG TPA: cytochrome P450 [Acidimicrobiales bacterium]|nr:cytochrome P450 [Acidimicrobiales bacterium]